MLDYLKRLFGFSKPEQAAQAPYKVEAPVQEPKKCGCGRSETGLCAGLHSIPDADWATHEKNPNKAPAKKSKAPAKKRTFVKREEGDAKAKVAKVKAPAKAKAPAKKPAAKKAN